MGAHQCAPDMEGTMPSVIATTFTAQELATCSRPRLPGARRSS